MASAAPQPGDVANPSPGQTPPSPAMPDASPSHEAVESPGLASMPPEPDPLPPAPARALVEDVLDQAANDLIVGDLRAAAWATSRRVGCAPPTSGAESVAGWRSTSKDRSDKPCSNSSRLQPKEHAPDRRQFGGGVAEA
jgi:hypothetical protein